MDTTLSDKTYVVTGTTSGIGLAVAESLVRRGASVIGVGRSPERGREAERRLRAANPSAQVTILTANLALQPEVCCLALQVDETLSAWNKPALDGLANIAGTFTYWMALTSEGFETQWAVNHLAPFLLTNRLLPLLQAAPQGRVVTVSSGSHYGAHINWDDPQLRRRYNGLSAYGHTKLANVLFTLELNRRLGADSTMRAFAADPGLVKTDIGLKGTPALVRRAWEWRRAGGLSPEESARGIVFLLTDQAIQRAEEIYWQHGHPKRTSRQALDTASAGRLWRLSA
jgi:NAD(P)-dependent dehydrogenase (short-subunit alcohol dehydrogenase family)